MHPSATTDRSSPAFVSHATQRWLLYSQCENDLFHRHAYLAEGEPTGLAKMEKIVNHKHVCG